MKKAILFLFVFCSFFVYSQNYVLNQKNEVIKVQNTQKKESIFCIKDGKTFYKGAKNRVYYYKTSKKTRKQYKYYVKKQK